MNYRKIFLRRGKEESLKRFHPWIFSGAIAKMDPEIEEGDIVSVYTSENKFIAVGHYQIGSIAVRILDFKDLSKHINFAFLLDLFARITMPFALFTVKVIFCQVW